MSTSEVDTWHYIKKKKKKKKKRVVKPILAKGVAGRSGVAKPPHPLDKKIKNKNGKISFALRGGSG
jgi:hypothetical protein